MGNSRTPEHNQRNHQHPNRLHQEQHSRGQQPGRSCLLREAAPHVLTSVRELAAELSPEISGVWFQPTTFTQKTGFGSREMPAFDMTRDGMALDYDKSASD